MHVTTTQDDGMTIIEFSNNKDTLKHGRVPWSMYSHVVLLGVELVTNDGGEILELRSKPGAVDTLQIINYQLEISAYTPFNQVVFALWSPKYSPLSFAGLANMQLVEGGMIEASLGAPPNCEGCRPTFLAFAVMQNEPYSHLRVQLYNIVSELYGELYFITP